MSILNSTCVTTIEVDYVLHVQEIVLWTGFHLEFHRMIEFL